jgi:uncharacterized protein YndB with AHSA1/START domain
MKTEGIELQLSRRFAAPRERVFDAWTSPEVLRRWWAAGGDWACPLAEVDLREGGRYRLAMQNPEGEVRTVAGEYVEVNRPGRLAYTWAWELEDGSTGAETLVGVDFRTDGDGTEVVLTHRGFADEEAKAMHEHGWEGCLANLERRVFAPEPVR